MSTHPTEGQLYHGLAGGIILSALLHRSPREVVKRARMCDADSDPSQLSDRFGHYSFRADGAFPSWVVMNARGG